MPEEFQETALQRYLSNELKIVNAHLPRQRKSLSTLLTEEYPQVSCSDGSVQSFKTKELEYLASLLDEEDRWKLLLPILIEIVPGHNEAFIPCPSGAEARIISAILDMSPSLGEGKLRIYRPQINSLRRVLKTTTQYVFSMGE